MNLKVLLNSKIIDIFIITLIFLSIFTFYIGVILFSGEEIYSISLHKIFSYNYYIAGDYSKIIKDKKYLLYVVFIIGLVISIDKCLDIIYNLFFIFIKNIGINSESNKDDKIDNSSKTLSKISDKDELEMQFIDNSEDY